MADPTPPRTDVLILTAAEGEDVAVRQVDEGGFGAWEPEEPPAGLAALLWRRAFRGKDGRLLQVLLARSPLMGGDAAATLAGHLVGHFRPRCLAMSGVCAGRPGKTELGDVIVADPVWRYDQGVRLRPTPEAEPRFLPRARAYDLPTEWRLPFEPFADRFPPEEPWLQTRPLPLTLQGLWLLRELQEGRDPLTAPDRARACPDWEPTVTELEARGWLADAALTPDGERYLRNALFRAGGNLPAAPKWTIRVGPLGTGNHLVRDVRIWDELQEQQEQVLGLEMEGAALGVTAAMQGWEHRPRLLIAKGVMDNGTPAKNDAFREFVLALAPVGNRVPVGNQAHALFPQALQPGGAQGRIEQRLPSVRRARTPPLPPLLSPHSRFGQALRAAGCPSGWAESFSGLSSSRRLESLRPFRRIHFHHPGATESLTAGPYSEIL